MVQMESTCYMVHYRQVINFEKFSWAETDAVSALFELENVVIVVYNDNTRNKKGGLYGDKN